MQVTDINMTIEAEKGEAHPAADGSVHILTINSGSSSVKFSVFRMGNAEEVVLTGGIDRIGLRASLFKVSGGDGRVLAQELRDLADHEAAFSMLFDWRDRLLGDVRPGCVGHRIVHGGSRFLLPHLVTDEVMAALVRLTPLAPDHLPHEVQAIRAVQRRYPRLPQVVCFDTAFHRDMPKVASMLPLSRYLWSEGVRRYGFHGLSYEYIMAELAREAGEGAARGRVIIAHLGNGASMAAVRDGVSVETTMGFTPLGGLVMGTRPGDMDPGVLLYLIGEKGFRPSTISDLLNKRAGLLAVSGMTSDMKELLVKEATEAHAAEAVDLFCYQAKKFVGALAAALHGLDTLVFTGGIGENAPVVRDRICEGLEFLGIDIAPAANAENRGIISAPGGRVTVRAMKTDEDLMVARHTRGVVYGHGAKGGG
jgi:acetate kinase